MKLYRFELLFFDLTVLSGKFCVGVSLSIQLIYLSTVHAYPTVTFVMIADSDYIMPPSRSHQIVIP